MRRYFACVIGLLILASCAAEPPVVALGPVLNASQQLMIAAPWLHDARYSMLLDFESPDDALFVQTAGNGAVVGDRGFTGHGSFRVDGNASRLSIKLDSLLAGRPFPADWSMIGGFCFAPRETRFTIRLGTISRDVDLPAGTWTPVFLDLPPPANATTLPASVPLEFDLPDSHGALWLDDVILVDNQKSLLDTSATGWTIERRGTQIACTSDAHFDFSLNNGDLTHAGWTCDEADALRARFHTDAGSTLTVYHDGRAYDNGSYKAMTPGVGVDAYAAANLHPATIDILESMGRVDRNSSGDANNDGYNEATGSYRIIAQSPRLELRFVPAAHVPDPRPVIEISGLPFGKVLATLEGRLIESSQRTRDGEVLIELPATIDRPATVDVRVEN